MNRKLVIAIFAGLVVSIILVYLLEMIGHLMYPVDMKLIQAFIDAGDVEGFTQFMLNMPIGAFMAVILAHGFGLLGGLVVCRLIYNQHRLPLFGLTAIVLISTLLNLFLVPHPSWFPYADIGFSLGLALAYIYSRKKA